MIQQTSRYGYVKCLNFTEFANNAINVGNNHFNYTFDFKGILNLTYYIVGVAYEPIIWDVKLGVIEKRFNYYDPLIQTQMQISMQSTNDIIGDNFDLSVSAGTWSRHVVTFSPGKLHDMSNFPLLVTDSTSYYIFDAFVDKSYTPTQLYFLARFMLFVGTGMPLKMADGSQIPPPVIDIP